MMKRRNKAEGSALFFLLYRKYCVVIKLKSTDSYRAKNAPLRIALRRSRVMWQKRPAAGGESCCGRIFWLNLLSCYSIFLTRREWPKEEVNV